MAIAKKATETKAETNIDVVVVRRMGVEDNTENGIAGTRMCDPGEVVSLSRDIARRLQDAGVIKVSI